MNKLHKISLATCLTGMMAFMPTTNAAQFTMKISHSASPGDPRDQGAKKVAEILNSSKTCDIKVQVYPSDQLGGSNSIWEQVQLGGVEVMIAPAANLVQYEPLMGILDLPYFWPSDPEQLLKVYQGSAMKDLLKFPEAHGFIVPGVWHTGYKNWTSNKELRTPEDFKGLIVRVMPSKILYKQNELLGMQNVSMNFGDTYSALQSGTIDAQDNPIPLIYNMKFYEVQKYVTMTNHGILDQVFAISKKFWDKLPEQCHGEIRTAIAEGGKVTYEADEKLMIEDLAKIKDSGTTIVELKPEEISAIKNVLQPSVKNYYVDLVGPQGAELVNKFENEFTEMGIN
ncbi:TRAP transporter substrate-binding protein [Allopusillimonas ginsengisoli]|nr:TRAP transporter substrate-binding protein [Allopusillimonas ginsengisoli]